MISEVVYLSIEEKGNIRNIISQIIKYMCINNNCEEIDFKLKHSKDNDKLKNLLLDKFNFKMKSKETSILSITHKVIITRIGEFLINVKQFILIYDDTTNIFIPNTTEKKHLLWSQANYETMISCLNLKSITQQLKIPLFNTIGTMKTPSTNLNIYSIKELEETKIKEIPSSIRSLLTAESLYSDLLIHKTWPCSFVGKYNLDEKVYAFVELKNRVKVFRDGDNLLVITRLKEYCMFFYCICRKFEQYDFVEECGIETEKMTSIELYNDLSVKIEELISKEQNKEVSEIWIPMFSYSI